MGRVINIGNESEDSFDGRKGDFQKKFWDNLSDSKLFFDQMKTDWKLFFKTYAGDPWQDAARDRMARTQRPITNFNYVLTVVNSLLGSQQQERREIQFKGVGKSLHDQQIAEWLTNVVRTFYSRSNGHRNESSVWLDTLITGYGWGHTYVDTSRYPFRISDAHVPIWEMYPDPDASNDNLTDARYVIRRKDWDKDEAAVRWPKAKNSIIGLDTKIGQSSPTPKAYGKHQDLEKGKRKREVISVYEYQFKKKEAWVAYRDPRNGNLIEVPEADYKEAMQELIDDPNVTGEVKPVKFSRDVCYRAYIAGDASKSEVLQKPEMMRCDEFTYKACTGYRERDYDEGRTRFFGILKQLYAPQLTISKTSTTMIEQLSRQSKGNWMYEPGSILDPENFLDDISTPGKPIPVDVGALTAGRIQEVKSPALSSAMAEMWRLAEAAIPALTGISEYSIGTATSERSNVLISNLQGQTMTTLAPIVDPLHGYRIEKGRVLAKFIQLYTVPEDIERYLEIEPVEGLTHEMRMNEETGQEELVPMVDEETGEEITAMSLIYDQDILEYDVLVDVGAATMTEKQQLWSVLGDTNLFVDMMERFPSLGSIADSFIRSLPGLPAADAERGAQELKEEWEFNKSMGQVNSMMQAFVEQMDPESQQQLFQQMMQFVQQQQQQQGGAPQ